jgi:tetratricopeptide (TPR) repeat protein
MRLALEESWDIHRVRRLFTLLLYAGRIDDAEVLRRDSLGPDSLDEESDSLEAQNDYGGALRALRRLQEETPNDRDLATRETYLLLRLGRFEECEDVARGYLEQNGWSDVGLIVNYELAKRLGLKKVNEQRIAKHLAVTKKSSEKAALAALLGHEDKCLDYIKQGCEESWEFKYVAATWIVFDKVRNNPRFSRLLEGKDFESGSVRRTGTAN